MRNFRELDIWSLGVVLAKDVYNLLKSFPITEKFGLVSQMSRCAVSISSNIAEGCSRDSQKDFSRFLQIALGSSFELETQLEISRQLNFINETDFTEILDKLNSLQRRIQALKSYVNKNLGPNT
ncbi:four helix bundle protein [Cellulophaga sp. Hel_I_12]|uniref:four helix bundle protein n=1 Tax=Cellulophaga sp. Hel_I_12 TaxID=1249972 RepID=UPI000647794B|nr:four helix bundle protein [Cellulophaga sp. Hel_I_12]